MLFKWIFKRGFKMVFKVTVTVYSRPEPTMVQVLGPFHVREKPPSVIGDTRRRQLNEKPLPTRHSIKSGCISMNIKKK